MVESEVLLRNLIYQEQSFKWLRAWYTELKFSKKTLLYWNIFLNRDFKWDSAIIFNQTKKHFHSFLENTRSEGYSPIGATKAKKMIKFNKFFRQLQLSNNFTYGLFYLLHRYGSLLGNTTSHNPPFACFLWNNIASTGVCS